MYWTNQNLVIDGYINKMNVFRYFLNCIVYVLVMNLVYITMYFANRADINVGIIITIWSLDPLYNSLASYYLYNEKLAYYHAIGLLSILLCSLALCLKDLTGSTETAQSAILVNMKDFLGPQIIKPAA